MCRGARRHRVFHVSLTAGEWRDDQHRRHRDWSLRYRFIGAWRDWQRDFLEYSERRSVMNSIIYIVGLVVVVLFVLGFLGLR